VIRQPRCHSWRFLGRLIRTAKVVKSHIQAIRRRPSRVALYDLQSERCVEEIETEIHGIGVVFTLLGA
jgi:hypothetical protein